MRLDLIDTGTSFLLSNFIDIQILSIAVISIFITLFGLAFGFLLLRLQSSFDF